MSMDQQRSAAARTGGNSIPRASNVRSITNGEEVIVSADSNGIITSILVPADADLEDVDANVGAAWAAVEDVLEDDAPAADVSAGGEP